MLQFPFWRDPRLAELAKLSRPELRCVHPRKRLFKLLDESSRSGAVWLVGPPGSGKTTLASGWLEQSKSRSLWFKVDEADGELATLFHYLGMAVNRVTRGKVTLPVFGAESQRGSAAFSRRFFRELWSSTPANLTVVLDDCHEPIKSSDFREALRAAIAERPAGKTLIMLSRGEPPPELARFAAQGNLSIIAPDELRLTSSEAIEIAALHEAKLSPRTVADLQQRTDGWAAGLVLLLSASEGSQSAAPGSADAPLLFDYLAGEVLDQLDSTTRQVLLETALLESVTPQAADQLTGLPSAGAVLAGLARRGWFVNRHGDHEPVFTLHPLFRELLIARGREQLPPEKLFSLKRAAARLQVERGELETAFDLFLQTSEYGEAARLVLTHAREVLAEGRYATLRRWILQLPTALRQELPWLEFWLGVSWLGFNPGELRQSMERAFDTFWQKGDPAGCIHSSAALVDSYLAEWGDLHPLDRWGTALDRIQERWPELPDQVLTGFFTCAEYTVLVSRRPADPATRVWEERVISLAAHSPEPALRRKAAFALAHYGLWRGDLPLARWLLDSLRPARGQWREYSPRLAWSSLQTRLLALSGRHEEAKQEVESAVELARSTGAHFLDVGLHGGAALAAIVGNTPAYADAHLSCLAPVPGSSRLNSWYFQFLSGAAHADNLTQAERLIQSSLEGARSSGTPLLALWSEGGLAALARARGDGKAFEEQVEKVEAQSRQARAHLVIWWCLLLRAAWLAPRERQRAVELFGEALSLSESFGPYTSWWISRDELAQLCQLSWESGRNRDKLRTFVQAHALPPPERPPGCDSWPYPVVVRVLGPFSMELNGQPVEFGRKRPKKILDLLRALIALGGTEVSEGRLMELLWPDADGDAAHHALEMTLHRLRKLAGEIPFVLQREGRLTIDRRVCGVDVFALEPLLAEQCPSSGSPQELDVSVARLRHILDHYRGPFLAEEQELPWASAPRERLRRQLRTRLELVVRALQRAGRSGEAEALWRLAVERDRAMEMPMLRLVSSSRSE